VTDEELAKIGHILYQCGWSHSSTMGGMGRRFIEELEKIGYTITPFPLTAGRDRNATRALR
jgi:hypothetical protein